MKMPDPAERAALLERSRSLKMARSAHAYVRGNTVKFYEWLASSPSAAKIPTGPPIWICGDCHLGNLGPLADADGKVEVQIRDLDQTVIGNPALDLIRLGLSLATAARGSDLPGVTTARMIEEMVTGYERAMADPDGEDGAPEPAAVRSVRREALGRRWRHLAKERIEDVAPTIPLGRKFWPLSKDERDALEALFRDAEMTRLLLELGGKEADGSIRLIDAAYWMKGCSSLGNPRYAVIIGLKGRKGGEEHAQVDLKQATKAAAPAAPGAKMPSDPAKRVVAGAVALSPFLGTRMLATRLLGKSFIVRELMPQDLKLEVDQFSQAEAVKAARYLAYVVGKAHARQLDGKARNGWRRALLDHRTSSIEAPLWLWESVVDLAGSHEVGYLQHCRQYAMAQPAQDAGK